VNGNWNNPERFVTTYTPHDIRAVVSQGNVLLAVWREDPGLGQHGIWFSYMVLDASETPVVPLATAPVSAPVQLDPISTFDSEVPTPLPINVLSDESPSKWRGNPAFPLIVGVLPVALVLMGIVVAFRFLAARRG
jgi:hypothetical protein